MKPIAIPVAMEKVRTIIKTTKKAGTAISNFVQSICATFPIIKIPTITSAGVVTALVITPRSGEKNSDKEKQIAITIAVNPVRPPTATPAVDST